MTSKWGSKRTSQTFWRLNSVTLRGSSGPEIASDLVIVSSNSVSNYSVERYKCGIVIRDAQAILVLL